MKLIRKLGTRAVNGRVESWGVFLCPIDNEKVERPTNNGLKAKTCGDHRHGGSTTKLYSVWRNIKQRVLNSDNKGYKNYGGRGITICPEWANDYTKFRDWALSNGYKEGLFFDRENPDGNYEPSNCRFLTMLESNRNKRNMVTLEKANEISGLWETGNYTQKELSTKFNVELKQINNILNNKTWKN